VADANWILGLVAMEINHFSGEELLISSTDTNARNINDYLVIPCYWLWNIFDNGIIWRSYSQGLHAVTILKPISAPIAVRIKGVNKDAQRPLVWWQRP
jgi:hypothetical protein